MEIISLETSKGKVSVPVAKIIKISKPKNMSGIGGAGAGKHTLVLEVAGGHVFHVSPDSFDTVRNALLNHGARTMEFTNQSKSIIINEQHICGVVPYDDPNIMKHKGAESDTAKLLLSDGLTEIVTVAGATKVEEMIFNFLKEPDSAGVQNGSNEDQKLKNG